MGRQLLSSSSLLPCHYGPMRNLSTPETLIIVEGYAVLGTRVPQLHKKQIKQKKTIQKQLPARPPPARDLFLYCFLWFYFVFCIIGAAWYLITAPLCDYQGLRSSSYGDCTSSSNYNRIRQELAAGSNTYLRAGIWNRTNPCSYDGFSKAPRLLNFTRSQIH